MEMEGNEQIGTIYRSGDRLAVRVEQETGKSLGGA